MFYRFLSYGIPDFVFASLVQLLILSTIHTHKSIAVPSLPCLIVVYIPPTLLALVYTCSNLLVLCLNSMSYVYMYLVASPRWFYASETLGGSV